MTPFESDALKGASSEAAREMKPFIEAVMELRKMPDVPKNPVDEADMLEAFREWNPDVTMDERRWAFEAGWRAAMAEVKKLPKGFGRGEVDRIRARVEERVDKHRYDHSREGF